MKDCYEVLIFKVYIMTAVRLPRLSRPVLLNRSIPILREPCPADVSEPRKTPPDPFPDRFESFGLNLIGVPLLETLASRSHTDA